jgi:outer membrane protein OmpA-like peptidoglycan-associated protein
MIIFHPAEQRLKVIAIATPQKSSNGTSTESRSGGCIVPGNSIVSRICGDDSMKGGSAMRGRRIIPIALACAVAFLSGGNAVRAEDTSTDDILKALAGGTTRSPRGTAEPAAGGELSPAERKVIEELIKRDRTRAPSLEEGRMVAESVSRNPSIDLEVTFDYDKAEVGPKAYQQVIKLGLALGDPKLQGATFVIQGHTDAAGSDEYNQKLSKRRAEAVKTFLVENFNLPSGRLLALGLGRSRLKNVVDPLAAENRRVQVVKAWQ